MIGMAVVQVQPPESALVCTCCEQHTVVGICEGLVARPSDCHLPLLHEIGVFRCD